MRRCQDCTLDIRRTNRMWTFTCFIVALFGVGSGFILGQLSVL